MSHNKKTQKIRKEVKVVLVIMGFIMVLVCGTLIYRRLNSFSYEMCLDDTVVTVSENEIKLREISYYVMKVERAGDEAAKIYDEKNPSSYWALYMNDEFKRSGYVSDLAKMSAMDNCVRDNIYYQEAVNNNYSLDEDVVEDVKYDADEEYNHMSKREKEVLGLTPELMESVMLKEALAHDYMLYLCGLYDTGDVVDGNAVMNNATLLYDINGSFYEQLKNDYNVIIDNKLWNKVRIGFVTIN